MGGGSERLRETEHFIFFQPYSLNGEYPAYYELKIVRKNPDDKYDHDKYAYASDFMDEESYSLIGEAFAELNKENKQMGDYEAMSKDNIALGEMYSRMVKAERDMKHWRKRAEKSEQIINSLEVLAHELKWREGKDD